MASAKSFVHQIAHLISVKSVGFVCATYPYTFRKCYIDICSLSLFHAYIMCRSDCSDPIPPGTPENINFFGVAPVFLSLYFCFAPPYINTLIILFSSALPFFITHIFPLTPGPRSKKCERLLR